jgi:hypothetical protein
MGEVFQQFLLLFSLYFAPICLGLTQVSQKSQCFVCSEDFSPQNKD